MGNYKIKVHVEVVECDDSKEKAAYCRASSLIT